MEALEKISTAFADKVKEGCLFKEDSSQVPQLNEEPEDIENDDNESVVELQANNGGVLGENLINASPGKEGTVGGPCPPPKMLRVPREDTERTGVQVHVPGADGVEDKVLPFTVAAHHLIPGNAALKKSDLYEFLKKDGSVESATGRRWTISAHVGYNVNGSHNGVWLPGSYVIRAGKTDMKETWSVLRGGKPNWCINYAASVVKVAGGQFHDTHVEYSEKVLETLGKLAVGIFNHLDTCEDCERRKKLPPPYIVKDRLYAISAYLGTVLKGQPSAWKRPWFTSDSLRNAVFSGARPSKVFMDAYNVAKKISPESQAEDEPACE
jgi:hypothetical protein